ncbi:uncharacterized protein [Palaemon carinicauda]|uniref:uncharacterized protein isoform X1 n=1 Tax=Palaemon carinicauda TaxID=392227 RepID=UPI0035B684D4
MRAEKWIVGSLLVVLSQVMVTSALGGYPGTFYRIMMMLNRDRKAPRTAPAPNQLWAILDPPASLGSLSKLHPRTNRIIRSAEDSRAEELLRQYLEERDAETEAPGEPVTEEPAPEEEEEVETEPPVTTEAPIICGGDINIGIDPSNLTIPDGRVFYEVIETPGWEEGEYPEDFECQWNLNVQNDCKIGMTIFTVKDGYIRETAACKEDYLKVVYPSSVESRYCGAIVSGGSSVSGTDLWTLESEVPRTVQLIFKAGTRTESSGSGGSPKGFQIELTSYCWDFTTDFLSRTTTTAAPGASAEEEEEEEEEEEVEVVTEIAEDPIAAEAPEDTGNDPLVAVPEGDLKGIIEDIPIDSEVIEEPNKDDQEAAVSLLGDAADETSGNPGDLLPSNLLPATPGAPIAPAGASSGGFIPIAPLRDSRSHWYPLLEGSGIALPGQPSRN